MNEVYVNTFGADSRHGLVAMSLSCVYSMTFTGLRVPVHVWLCMYVQREEQSPT